MVLCGILLLTCSFCFGLAVRFENRAVISKTQGYPWPLPANYWFSSTSKCHLDPKFHFIYQQKNLLHCDIVLEAERRFQVYTDYGVRKGMKPKPMVVVKNIVISIRNDISSDCKPGILPPSKNMDEEYWLTIDCSTEKASLEANSVWGFLRAMETLTQVFYTDSQSGYPLVTNSTLIHDKPYFPWRGLLIDTGHRFQPVSILLKNLEVMAMNKMNVFHWHLVDDPSFPFVSSKFAQLSQRGAYFPVALHSYSEVDVEMVCTPCTPKLFLNCHMLRLLIKQDYLVSG